ncbi:hypothetical protein W822_01830 [Advenella kashmirensis W13003]|uniref:Uncharacterized protein n=1 Tax=Advenella kashmirensis W13003 TaxID=1424334 RepID=V8QXM5_9BURK|nr:hypothetical protein [Advenella kashmirensis]ETF04666.1 hypothetical protein W822_01830 [Advenella kashmirensis W13003]
MKPNATIFKRRSKYSVKNWKLTWKDILPISVSALAALFSGYTALVTQKYTTDTTVQKDYVQIAIQILREPRRDDDSEIRLWAKKMVDKNSPVPIPQEAADQLSVSKILIGWTDNHPILNRIMKRSSECPAVDISEMPVNQHSAVESLKKQCDKNSGDLTLLKTYLRMIKDGAK